MSRDVVITGVGAISPLGIGAQTLHDRWVAGESGIADGVARCDDFDPNDHLNRRLVRRTDRFTQMALVAAGEALGQAGWDEGLPYPEEEVGCVIGTGVGGLPTIEDTCEVMRERGGTAISPIAVSQMMANAAAGATAIHYGFKGECYGTVAACSAGGFAIGAGKRIVQVGATRACVVGGTEAAITPLAIAAFAQTGATSQEGISRPFDRRRDGFVLGEGAGVMVLEDAEAAAERGAPVLARLAGYGASEDAHHLTAPDPHGEGAARAIKLALRDAGVEPERVDYVNAHGTSTPLNDRTETEALKSALGSRAAEIPVSALKSSIGHLIGGAGAIEAVATVISLRERIAPPTINLEEFEDGLDLDYVPLEAKPLERNSRPLFAISNSFGFGGHNAVLCIEAVE